MTSLLIVGGGAIAVLAVLAALALIGGLFLMWALRVFSTFLQFG